MSAKRAWLQTSQGTLSTKRATIGVHHGVDALPELTKSQMQLVVHGMSPTALCLTPASEDFLPNLCPLVVASAVPHLVQQLLDGWGVLVLLRTGQVCGPHCYSLATRKVSTP